MGTGDARSAVGQFVVRTRELAGGVDEQVAAILEDCGETYSTSTLYAWGRGDNPAPGHVLFALARRFEQSLDQFALGESLAQQLSALTARVASLGARVEVLEADTGRPAGAKPATRPRRAGA